MSPFLVVILMVIGVIIIFQAWIYLRSKQSIGATIPFDKIEKEFAEKTRNKNGLLYFYSPTCYNCKSQTPIIEKIKKERESIFSIDTTKHLQTARALNVMGTPSIVFFSGNKISGYYVGVKSESFIVNKLQSI